MGGAPVLFVNVPLTGVPDRMLNEFPARTTNVPSKLVSSVPLSVALPVTVSLS